MTFSRLLLLFSITLLAACATSKSGSTYSREQARQEMYVRMGTLESIRVVELEGTRSGVGSVAGAVVGGVAGSHLGGGSGQIVGGILVALLGGLAGNAIENEATRRQALELTVRLDDGHTIAIVQEDPPQEFRPGDRVRVLSGADGTRVTR